MAAIKLAVLVLNQIASLASVTILKVVFSPV